MPRNRGSVDGDGVASGGRKREKPRFACTDFTVIRDTREQHPYEFRGLKGASGAELIVKVADRTLKSGDYSIEGMESRVSIERKSLADLYSTLTHGRERFERELDRLRSYDFSKVVIEASWLQIARCPPPGSQVLPKSILRSILAFEQRYPTRWAWYDTRAAAEAATFRTLERFWFDDQQRIKEAARAAALEAQQQHGVGQREQGNSR